MAGGVGSRFWPLSRRKQPKQFLDILGHGDTLFQATYKRLSKVCLPENIYIVTNENYRDEVVKQIPEIEPEQILGEPHPRNTAPCIAYAAFKIFHKDHKAVMAIMPSDHIILDETAFTDTLNKGFAFCNNHDMLLTLGIQPTRPDTGYGYIQFDEENDIDGICKVKTFTEKPNHELANHFIKSGEFLWNSGMFLWKASVIIEELQKHLPEIYDTFHKGNSKYFTDKEAAFITKAYDDCANISIDYGIMEKASNAYVLPAAFNWSDIGTWDGLYSISKKDDHNNVIHGDMVFARNTSNCMINVPNKYLVALNNVENLIVVEHDGVLLIAEKSKEQEIRQVVNDIKLKFGDKYI